MGNLIQMQFNVVGCVNFDRMLMGYVGASGSGFKKGRDERWTPLLFPSGTRRSV